MADTEKWWTGRSASCAECGAAHTLMENDPVTTITDKREQVHFKCLVQTIPPDEHGCGSEYCGNMVKVYRDEETA